VIVSEVGIMESKAPSLKPKASSVKRIDILAYATLAAIVVFAIAMSSSRCSGASTWKSSTLTSSTRAPSTSSRTASTHGTPGPTRRGGRHGGKPIRAGASWHPIHRAAAYLFLTSLGLNVTLYDVCAFFPVFAGGILVILAFFLGKQLVNRGIGLLTAFVFAVDPTAIQRTALGFFDTESTGMIGMFIALIFFLKSLKGRTIPYAIISGLAMAYMALC